MITVFDIGRDILLRLKANWKAPTAVSINLNGTNLIIIAIEIVGNQRGEFTLRADKARTLHGALHEQAPCFRDARAAAASLDPSDSCWNIPPPPWPPLLSRRACWICACGWNRVLWTSYRSAGTATCLSLVPAYSLARISLPHCCIYWN